MTTATADKPHRYQRWTGELDKGRWTWLAIARAGVSLPMKEARTRVMVLTVGLIVLGGCIVLYVISLLELLAGTQEAAAFAEFVHGFLGVDLRDVSEIGEFREILWRTLFLFMIKAQMFWVLVVVSKVGPGLIAQDLKHRALPIYFSKPVTPWTYLGGKWIVLATFIALVTLIPNLILLTAGTMVTGGLQTWGQTLDLGLDLIVSGAVVCVCGGAIMLALSSMSSDYRYVTVAWLAVCLLTAIGQTILNDQLPAKSTTGWLGCISLRNNVLTLTDWLFGTREALEVSSLSADAFARAVVRPVRPFCAGVVLGGWTLAAILLSYWRIVKFSRSAANV